MTTLVFVHGGWGRPDDWDSLISLIGDRATCAAADLPSCQSPEAALADDATHVRGLIEEADDDVVLVGHSYGGMVITEAADEHVRQLVYLAAFVPEVGRSAADLALSAGGDPFYTVNENGTLTVENWDAYATLYESEAFLRSRPRRPSSIASVSAACTNAGWQKVPSTYLIARRDTAVPPALQRAMSSHCKEVAVGRRALPVAGQPRPGHGDAAVMLTPDELAHTYAAAWLEKDPTARRELLERCCQPDVRFLQEGSQDEVVGIDQLEKTITDFQASWPAEGTVDVQITTPVQEHHGYGRGGFVWIFPGDERGYGTDFVEVRDGRMQTIVVFADPGPPTTA